MRLPGHGRAGSLKNIAWSIESVTTESTFCKLAITTDRSVFPRVYNRGVRNFTAYVEYDPASRLYVGIVPGLPGAHTQAATLEELRANLKEVLELCSRNTTAHSMNFPRS